MSDKDKHEEIDLNEQEEVALDVVWSKIEKNGFPEDDFEDDEDNDEVLV